MSSSARPSAGTANSSPGAAYAVDEYGLSHETDGLPGPMPGGATAQRAPKRRRKGQPPLWFLKLSSFLQRFRKWLGERFPRSVQGRRDELVTMLVSVLLHAFLALILALWVLPGANSFEFSSIEAKAGDLDEEPLLELPPIEEILQPETLEDHDVDSVARQMDAIIPTEALAATDVDRNDDPLRMNLISEIADFQIPFEMGDFGGRSAAAKQTAVRKYGGTVDSEKAVMSGLKWLRSIQREDGSWRFNELGGSGGEGVFQRSEMGATSMALLCFLGAGHTHAQDGPFQEVVQKGLAYMSRQAKDNGGGLDLRGNYEGNSGMYIQGLATIVLCEAAAMEPADSELRRGAQMAVTFVEAAQDKKGGGWRYGPGQPGDTSVVGWQVMALQSAKTGKLRVNGQVLRLVRIFLRSVSADDGALYGYTGPQDNRPAMTAVGLLCQMYLGMRKESDSMERGVNYLAARGPHPRDMYYNYYATQVLHHWEGDLWTQWNQKMREQLVKSQVQEGPGAGSWDPTDPHANTGGRLYQTALCLLTLEVYYRHLPMYHKLEKPDPEEAESEANDAAETE